MTVAAVVEESNKRVMEPLQKGSLAICSLAPLRPDSWAEEAKLPAVLGC